MWNVYLSSGGGEIPGGGLGTSFLSTHGSKIGVKKCYICGTMVGIAVGYTVVEVLVKEYFICDVKEPVELWGGGAGAATIMEFWTMEGYSVVFLICVYMVSVKIIFGVGEGAG